ncbi:MAG: 50S ribosomal protein L32 [Cytophagales bacterium]|nr:50S ribosomal protein L32 [Cytophagales bacterium]MDW8383499.1 50S ribosomal protein L32 [Flammeovirgaceae bacterium]
MPNPKRKFSKTRTALRRSQIKLKPVQLSVCQTTSEVHQRHRAYWVEGKMYYNGRVVIDNTPAEADASEN